MKRKVTINKKKESVTKKGQQKRNGLMKSFPARNY